MEIWLVAVDHVGRHDGHWTYIQGATRNGENDEKTVNLGRMPHTAYSVLWVCAARFIVYTVNAVVGVIWRSLRWEMEWDDCYGVGRYGETWE